MTVRNRIVSFVAGGIFFLSSVVLADGDHQVFNLGNFEFESGATLSNTFISYITYGKLNEDRSNVVVLPSWYSGDHHGYDYLIGDDKAIDPGEYFIVATDMFSNGLSSSPSNTPRPYDGPRFPDVAIRDNVRAAKRLLSEVFDVNHIRAIVGFSMGAQQALQWAVSYPNSVDVVVAFCGNAKEYPFGIVRLEGAKSALMADSAWQGGDYSTPPEVGLRAIARHWAAWGVSQEWWRQETFRSQGVNSIEDAIELNEEYMLARDANNLIWQANTWQRHNVADTPGFDGDFDAALGSIKARVLLMPSETDLYFPVADAEYEQERIPGAKLVRIPSIWGHSVPNDPEAVGFLNAEISNFLDAVGNQ